MQSGGSLGGPCTCVSCEVVGERPHTGRGSQREDGRDGNGTRRNDYLEFRLRGEGDDRLEEELGSSACFRGAARDGMKSAARRSLLFIPAASHPSALGSLCTDSFLVIFSHSFYSFPSLPKKEKEKTTKKKNKIENSFLMGNYSR